MKQFVVLAALAAAGHGLPAVSLHTDSATQAANYTQDLNDRPMGFASVDGGTRGGAGGEVWTVWDPWALRDAVHGDKPRVVYVRGRIDLGLLSTEPPGVMIVVGSYKTIIGADAQAEITGGGLHIKRSQHVIIRNLKFTNAISYAPGERPDGNGGIIGMQDLEVTETDAIRCEASEHIWVDHNEFSDDPWVSDSIPKERMRHDGLLDVKRASDWVTVSNNIFRNHNKVSLVGHSDSNGSQDAGHLRITFVKNWFKGTTQRNPRVRYGTVHVLNNLYTDMGKYGVGAGAGSLLYVENNVFVNSKAWRHPSGTPNPMGYLLAVGNLLENSTHLDVPSSGVTWKPRDYYQYQAQDASTIADEIRRNAGTWS